jgi:hypothetical protein
LENLKTKTLLPEQISEPCSSLLPVKTSLLVELNFLSKSKEDGDEEEPVRQEASEKSQKLTGRN